MSPTLFDSILSIVLAFLDIYWQIMERNLTTRWWKRYVSFLTSSNAVTQCTMLPLMESLMYSTKHFANCWRNLSPNIREICMKECKNIFGHIGPPTVHTHVWLLILLFMELKKSFHSSVKFRHYVFPFKKNSPTKKILDYILKNMNLLMKINMRFNKIRKLSSSSISIFS